MIYLDTSAAMKLIVEEAESAALAERLAQEQLVASWLLHTELHRASRRHPRAVPVPLVTAVLESVALVDLTRGDLLVAGGLAGTLRSHDAIHLAAALRLEVTGMATYDAELATSAEAAGLVLVQPT